MDDYDPHGFPPFAVTVDMVVFTIRRSRLQIVLIRRGAAPFEGAWALPGGFVRVDEDLEDAARRELAEETGITTAPSFLTQLRTYGSPDRDPRMRVVSVAWWAIMPISTHPVAGSDAASTELIDVDDVTAGRIELAFDHRLIVSDALEALGDRLETTTLATSFWTEEFRISDLRRIYETVWGVELEPGNFQRKVRRVPGWLQPTGRRAPTTEGGRPAELFRAEPGLRPLTPPLRRRPGPDPR